MQYTVLFFATSAERLAQEMKDDPAAVLEKSRAFLAEHCDDEAAIGAITEAVEALCRGDLPAEAPQSYFDAFLSIAESQAERIALGSFEFNSCVFMEDIGVWPFTQQESPPFPTPRSTGALPAVGFMSCQFMREVVLPGIEEMPPCEIGGDMARNEFAEMVESVIDDGLDLIAYYSVW